MKPLSPVNALAPAFSRVSTLLIPADQPRFRFGFFLKIAAVAAFTNPAFYGASLGFLSQGFSLSTLALTGRMHASHWMGRPGVGAVVIAILAVAAVALIALSLLMGWVVCRLRFTLFDLVVYRRGRVAAAWSTYGAQTWRYLGLLVLLTLGLLLLTASTVGPVFLHVIAALRGLTPQQIHANPAAIFTQILPLYGILFLVGIVATLADALSQDFLLPPMALEDAALQSAFGRLFRLLRDRFWSVLGYLLLRFVLEIGLNWAGMMAVMLVFGAAGAAGAGVGFVLYGALWHLGGAAAVLFILFCLVAGMIVLCLWLLAMIILYGLIALWKQCYAVYFYGSHYRQLGNRLEPGEAELSANPAPLVPPALPQPPPVW